MAPLLVPSPGILVDSECGDPTLALASIPRPYSTPIAPFRFPFWPPPGTFPLWRRPQARGSPPPAA